MNIFFLKADLFKNNQKSYYHSCIISIKDSIISATSCDHKASTFRSSQVETNQRLELINHESGFNLAKDFASLNYEYSQIEFEFDHFNENGPKKSDTFVKEFFSSLCDEDNLARGLDGHSSNFYEVISYLRTHTKQELISLLNNQAINKCALARY